MKRQLLLAAFAAAAMLAGCSKSEPQTTPETPTIPAADQIRAVATVEKSIEVDTKAPNTATSAEGLQVYVYAYKTYFTAMVAEGTMTFKAGATEADAVTFDAGFKGVNQLPKDNAQVFVQAFYPSAGWTTRKSDSGNHSFACFDFTGCEDVMCSQASYIARDPAAIGGKTKSFAAFEMKHFLTRFDITAKAANADAAAIWGKIKSIVLKKGDGSVFSDVLENEDDDFSDSFTSKNNLTKWPSYQITKTADKTVYTDDKFAAADFAGAFPLTTTATPHCYTMMTPFTANAATNEIVLEITTLDKEGGTDVVTNVEIDLDPAKMPDGDGWTRGVFFSLNLTFGVKEVKAVATITPWSDPVVIDKVID